MLNICAFLFSAIHNSTQQFNNLLAFIALSSIFPSMLLYLHKIVHNCLISFLSCLTRNSDLCIDEINFFFYSKPVTFNFIHLHTLWNLPPVSLVETTTFLSSSNQVSSTKTLVTKCKISLSPSSTLCLSSSISLSSSLWFHLYVKQLWWHKCSKPFH